MSNFSEYLQYLDKIKQEYKISHDIFRMGPSDGVCKLYNYPKGCSYARHYVYVWLVDSHGWPETALYFSSRGVYKSYTDMGHLEHTNNFFIKGHSRLEDCNCLCKELL